jgi:magnesium transporter
VLSEEFGLHPVAVEAALRPGQRPKLDRYRSHLLLTAYGARLDTGTGELTTSEIAAFITSKTLVTVRQDDGLDIDAVVERWDESPDLQIRGRLPAVRAAGLHRRWPVRGGPEPG